MCGPALVVIRMDDIPITVSQHFPLDGTYYDDEHVGQLLAGLYNDDDDYCCPGCGQSVSIFVPRFW